VHVGIPPRGSASVVGSIVIERIVVDGAQRVGVRASDVAAGTIVGAGIRAPHVGVVCPRRASRSFSVTAAASVSYEVGTTSMFSFSARTRLPIAQSVR